MGHLLENLVMAFLCLSAATIASATRKEELERAAELAVERAAERAAERAVEKALEAGNTTTTTITVKESYSNARKTAEEQAAPGSESTRPYNKKTAFFESKDFYGPDYEAPFNGSESSDYKDAESYSEEDTSVESGYFNESRGYNDYNNSKEYVSSESSNNSGSYRESDNEPRGFRDHNSSKINENYELTNYKNYKDSKGYRNSQSNNSKESKEYDVKSLGDYSSSGDYGASKGYEVEEDYTILNGTDYRRLNSSKTLTDSEIPFEDFDWTSNDSDFRHEFGSKLTRVGTKLVDSSLEEDLSFYSTETDFLNKRNSKKEEEDDEISSKDNDSWKSYSDWKKDFKSIAKGIGDKTFSKDLFWDDEDESSIKGGRNFWIDDDILSSETKNVEKAKEPEDQEDSKPTSDVTSSIVKPQRRSSGRNYNFERVKLRQSSNGDEDNGNKNSKLSSKVYNRRSSGDDNLDNTSPPIYKHLSRDYDFKDDGINATTEKDTSTEKTTKAAKRTTDESYEGYWSRNQEQFERGFENRSTEEHKESSEERSEGKYNTESLPKIIAHGEKDKVTEYDTSAGYKNYKTKSIKGSQYKIYPNEENEAPKDDKEAESESYKVKDVEERKYKSYSSEEEKISENDKRPEYQSYNIENNEESKYTTYPDKEDKTAEDINKSEYKSYKRKNVEEEEYRSYPGEVKTSDDNKSDYQFYKVRNSEENKFQKHPNEEDEVLKEDKRYEYPSYDEEKNKQGIYRSYPYKENEKGSDHVRRPEFPPHKLERSEQNKSKNYSDGENESVLENVRLEYLFYRPYNVEKNEENKSKNVQFDLNGKSNIRESSEIEEKIPDPMNIYTTVPAPIPHTYSNILPYNPELFSPYRTEKKNSDDKVGENVRVNVPVPVKTVPISVPGSIGAQVNKLGIPVNSFQENFQGNLQENYERSSLQIPTNLELTNIPKDYPHVPSTTLTVPKAVPKEAVNRFPPENLKLLLEKQRLQRLQKHYPKLSMDDRLPVLVKYGLPGPFPVDNINLPSDKPQPIDVHTDKPYTIHLDKSIPIALERRIPFIIHLPLKPQEKQRSSENNPSKKVENSPLESQNWFQRIRWIAA